MHTKSNQLNVVNKAVCDKCKSRLMRYIRGSIVCANCEHVIYKPERRNKYNASKATYKDYKYDSQYEASIAAELDIRKRTGDIKDWERQKTIRLDVDGSHVCNYRVDFVIHHNDGMIEYVEAKGLETPLWRIKWRLFEILHEKITPGSTLTVVKQNQAYRKKKT